MKRLATLIACSLIAVLAIDAQQPKVAVFDAQTPKGMDAAIVVPVTEKIMERLVVSGRYTVLDRANIEQVFQEREFQLSDAVSDQEAVAAAGNYLGADFVVVAKIQQIGETYFLSSKMIAVATGVIVNQASAEGEGKLASLIGLAGKVGDVLSSKTIVAAVGQKSESTAPKPGKQPKPSRTPKAVGESSNSGLGWLSVGATMAYSRITTDLSRTLISQPPIVEPDRPQTLTDVNSYIRTSLWADATYAEISIGYGQLFSGEYDSSGDWYLFWPSMTGSDPKPEASGNNSYEESFFSIAALAKYPFRLGPFTLFPLVGIEYDLNLTYTGMHGATNAWSPAVGEQEAEPGEEAAQNRLFLLGGAGVDYDIAGSLFIRAQCLYGYKFLSRGDKDRIDGWPEVPGLLTYSDGEISAWKIDALISLGYRL